MLLTFTATRVLCEFYMENSFELVSFASSVAHAPQNVLNELARRISCPTKNFRFEERTIDICCFQIRSSFFVTSEEVWHEMAPFTNEIKRRAD